MPHRLAPQFGIVCLLGLPMCSTCAAAQPGHAALAAFDAYTAALERRVTPPQTVNLASANPPGSANPVRPSSGGMLLERLTPPDGLAVPGALIHHWRGTIFLPGVHAPAVAHLLLDVARYPEIFAPQVQEAHLLAGPGEQLHGSMRVRQQHILTVVLQIAFDLSTVHLDAQHGTLCSRSTAITEIASAGTATEHPLSPTEDHGFLWRQNTWWTFAEQSGGLRLQLDSVSLTRTIPRGLHWAVAPFAESIPRDSLTFTLRSATNALHP